ncbi:hypothetical protein ENSA5_09980 [Enhygromyxa salina]|uniref:Serine protease n=1 Tax=Enhygromyxa salina TaxID=215803 RepID=A0A2S9YGI2_9BACT|nr:serine protease [Enhygromyxa salina]PRQ04214.1 hypothetical protein ENSA5_09980 [Enhygromyxa salina]
MFSAAPLDQRSHRYNGLNIDPRVVVVADGAFGNGFFVDKWRDTVVTAWHVVEGSASVKIEAQSSDSARSTVWFDACAVAWDGSRDLAVIRLPGSVRGFTTPLQARVPHTAVEAVLQGYESYDAWRAAPRRWRKWQAVTAAPSGDWLVYGETNASGEPQPSPGLNGFSGGAVIEPGSGEVIGVHHGAIANESNRASMFSLDLIDQLRSKAYEIG